MKLKEDKYYEELESKGYYETLDKRTRDYKEYKYWKELKSDPNELNVTYEELKANIEENNNSSVGLGDVVEKIAEVTGIKKVVEAITDDCGCDERKERFNKIPVWSRRKVNCIEQSDYIWLKQLIESRPSRYDFETRERLVRVYNSIFNTKQKNTKCYPCIKGLLDNLKDYLKVWEGEPNKDD